MAGNTHRCSPANRLSDSPQNLSYLLIPFHQFFSTNNDLTDRLHEYDLHVVGSLEWVDHLIYVTIKEKLGTTPLHRQPVGLSHHCPLYNRPCDLTPPLVTLPLPIDGGFLRWIRGLELLNQSAVFILK